MVGQTWAAKPSQMDGARLAVQVAQKVNPANGLEGQFVMILGRWGGGTTRGIPSITSPEVGGPISPPQLPEGFVKDAPCRVGSCHVRGRRSFLSCHFVFYPFASCEFIFRIRFVSVWMLLRVMRVWRPLRAPVS